MFVAIRRCWQAEPSCIMHHARFGGGEGSTPPALAVLWTSQLFYVAYAGPDRATRKQETVSFASPRGCLHSSIPSVQASQRRQSIVTNQDVWVDVDMLMGLSPVTIGSRHLRSV